MSEIRKKTVEGLKVGDTFTITRTFSEEEVIQFAHITKDYNPVHFDGRFANVKRFNGRICHGLLVASMVTQVGGQIGWLASGMDFVFKKPVFFGDTVTCSFKITEIGDRGRARADAQFFQEDGELILEAVVTGIIPGDPEKEILKAMLHEGDPTNKVD